jgi:RNA polymerase sigma-70 factor (ECF subfamily)
MSAGFVMPGLMLRPGSLEGGADEKALRARTSAVTSKSGPEVWLDEHGDVLYRYALIRVRKPEVAQDLVQETFLSAIRGYAKFAGGSTVRSWLCGILKHKICDYYRKLGRETSFTDMEFLADECGEKFVPEGFWVHMTGPKEWRPDPDEVMHRGEFWQTMRDCLGKLPERVAAVFMLREMDDVASKEICRMLSISENNLWVMLHRARMALRECLALNWFENPEVQH